MSDIKLDKRPAPARGGSTVQRSTGLILGVTLIVMVLVAGLNFTFSAAVMPALAGVDDHTFVVIMQRFNVNPVFAVSFTAALLITILAIVLQRRIAPGPATRWIVAALVLYGVVVAISAAIHLPLNEQISQAGDPDHIADLAHLRNQVEAPWVAWNVIRTVFCTAAVAALARALVLNERQNAEGTRQPRG